MELEHLESRRILGRASDRLGAWPRRPVPHLGARRRQAHRPARSVPDPDSAGEQGRGEGPASRKVPLALAREHLTRGNASLGSASRFSRRCISTMTALESSSSSYALKSDLMLFSSREIRPISLTYKTAVVKRSTCANSKSSCAHRCAAKRARKHLGSRKDNPVRCWPLESRARRRTA